MMAFTAKGDDVERVMVILNSINDKLSHQPDSKPIVDALHLIADRLDSIEDEIEKFHQKEHSHQEPAKPVHEKPQDPKPTPSKA
jgi:hypothetical protein